MKTCENCGVKYKTQERLVGKVIDGRTEIRFEAYCPLKLNDDEELDSAKLCVGCQKNIMSNGTGYISGSLPDWKEFPDRRIFTLSKGEHPAIFKELDRLGEGTTMDEAQRRLMADIELQLDGEDKTK